MDQKLHCTLIKPIKTQLSNYVINQASRNKSRPIKSCLFLSDEHYGRSPGPLGRMVHELQILTNYPINDQLRAINGPKKFASIANFGPGPKMYII